MTLVVDAASVEDASSLISLERYRLVTGDSDSLDADVSAALGLALELAQDYLQRRLVLDEYTETLTVIGHKVYPTNTPIVSAPDYVIRGAALVASYETWDLFSPNTLAEVTYSGGFEEATLPPRLGAAICNLAYGILQGQQASSSTAPKGVTSIALGDVRVGYGNTSGSTGTKELPADIQQTLKGYRKRRL